MSRGSWYTGSVVLGASIAVALAGCSTSVERPGDPVWGDVVDQLVDDEGTGDAPEECLEVSIYSVAGADIADVTSQPADWPAPPAGSVLCATSGSANAETASYASALTIDEVFDHYASSLPSGYDAVVLSGEENGTGYASLDGAGAGVAFQIRANDGGFTIVFASDGGQS